MKSQKNKSGFRKVVTLFVRLLFLACMSLVLLFVFQMIKNPEQPPSIFGYQPFTVLSNSMNPSIETGDMLIVKTVDASKINVNDVITFKEGANKYITHRVVEVINEGGTHSFVTKGDNNNAKDEKIVSPESLVGKQVFLIANAGFIAKFVSGKMGFLLLIILPLTGYICLELYERMNKLSNSRKSSTEK